MLLIYYNNVPVGLFVVVVVAAVDIVLLCLLGLGLFSQFSLMQLKRYYNNICSLKDLYGLRNLTNLKVCRWLFNFVEQIYLVSYY